MDGEWREVALEDVAREITVGYVGPMASEYVETGVPFLRSQNVDPLRINTDDLKYISDEFHARIAKSRLAPDDVVIVRTGKPGACAVIPSWLKEANCSDLVIVRCGADLDSRFLAYYVNTAAAHHVASHLVGAVQQHFNVGSARTLRITLPPIMEQKAIASILGALDDKIDTNQTMNRTLEATSRAIFQSWFIDFDPVYAKAEGRSPNPSAAVTALFPDTLQESELGDIPKGWEVKTVWDIAEVVGGGTPRTAEPSYWEGGLHYWATPKDLSKLSNPVLLETERTVTDAGLAQISSGLLPVGSVLLSSRAPIGYLAVAEVPVAINQGFIAMKPRKNVSNLFLLLWARAAHDEIVSRANGSTFLEISKANFRPIPLVVPPFSVFAAFDKVVGPLHARIVSNLRESRALASLRDALLPKLISGELRVPDVERIVARCA